eukprot:m.51818 g.51818  ORF g.51818 m.51818 type:complete len:166 (+) comp10967_c0_seq1:112-609(+)
MSNGEEGFVAEYGVVGDSDLMAPDLERMLQKNVKYIGIENALLAGKVESAIEIGNRLHKTAVLSGLGALVVGVFSGKQFETVCFALGGLSAVCSLWYMADWQFDPLCKYQVAPLGVQMPQVEAKELTIIERKDDSARKVLHTTISAISGLVCLRKALKGDYLKFR